MVFRADTALAVELLALVAGTALLLYSGKEGVAHKAFGKVVAYFTIVLSLLTLLCTGYYSLRFWEDGYFSSPRQRFHHGRRSGPRSPGFRGRGFEGREPGMRGRRGERPQRPEGFRRQRTPDQKSTKPPERKAPTGQ